MTRRSRSIVDRQLGKKVRWETRQSAPGRCWRARGQPLWSRVQPSATPKAVARRAMLRHKIHSVPRAILSAAGPSCPTRPTPSMATRGREPSMTASTLASSASHAARWYRACAPTPGATHVESFVRGSMCAPLPRAEMCRSDTCAHGASSKRSKGKARHVRNVAVRRSTVALAARGAVTLSYSRSQRLPSTSRRHRPSRTPAPSMPPRLG